MKTLLSSQEHSDSVRRSVLGFSPKPQMKLKEQSVDNDSSKKIIDKLKSIQCISTDQINNMGKS